MYSAAEVSAMAAHSATYALPGVLLQLKSLLPQTNNLLEQFHPIVQCRSVKPDRILPLSLRTWCF